ncbi:hypothetical protein DFS33DRAFT_1278427 [Desarmillaria ectypa]|nr:hypothetical protein DFS33DRAFT_1278427 [Desarmillaria ectypa]
MLEGSLDSTFGAFLIGAIVSACLFGITCTQTWYYYGHYSDIIFLKALHFSLSSDTFIRTLEAVHAAFVCHAAYFYVVTQYGNVAGLSDATWSASLTLCVTLFLALGRHLASSAAVAGYSMKLKSYALFETHVMTSLLKAAMSLYLSTDFLVAASLCYYLHTNRTGLKWYDLFYLSNETHEPIHSSTDTIINRLMIHAINNGLLTG